MDKPFPHVSPALVAALEELFPMRLPAETDTDRKIWMEVGKQGIIQFLRSKMEESMENALTSDSKGVIPRS